MQWRTSERIILRLGYANRLCYCLEEIASSAKSHVDQRVQMAPSVWKSWNLALGSDWQLRCYPRSKRVATFLRRFLCGENAPGILTAAV